MELAAFSAMVAHKNLLESIIVDVLAIDTHRWKKHCAKLIMQRFSETSMDVEKIFHIQQQITNPVWKITKITRVRQSTECHKTVDYLIMRG